MLFAVLFFTAFLFQQSANQSKPEIPVLKAGLGTCAADFVVSDANGKPVYQATIHARIRYGALSVKRMDVEVNTNDEGKARIEGLPNKAKPIVYDIEKNDTKGTTQQDVTTGCLASLQVTLK
ncbi:MAG TPA: hypothetical protein VF456_08790 [Vicinamibacterales bacterium]